MNGDDLEFIIECHNPDETYDFDDVIDVNPYDMDYPDYENWLDDLND